MAGQFTSNSIIPSFSDMGKTIGGGIANTGTVLGGAAGGIVKNLPIVNMLFQHRPKDWRLMINFPMLDKMYEEKKSTPGDSGDDGFFGSIGKGIGDAVSNAGDAFLKQFQLGGGNKHLLDPLRAVGNKLIFPYTPIVIVNNSSQYTDVSVTHSNYTFPAYQNSMVEEITITADFPVEIEADGLYWIAVVHFLRIVTKMAYGKTTGGGVDVQGNPPPVMYLNGYGDFMFPNVPIIIKKFTVELPKDVDYIQCTIPITPSQTEIPMGSPETESKGLQSMGDAYDKAGGGFAGVGAAIGAGKDLLDEFAGFNKGFCYVPTKSTFTLFVMPVYSKTKVKNFSLDDFIDGKYIKNKNGLI